jgi:sugar-specific transcriptional regulator TrmB
MKSLKVLEELGLEKKEAKVYLTLLELGQTNVYRIAQKSKINRSTVYYLLDNLKKAGLVEKILSGGKTYYSAEDPRVLEDILERKKKILIDGLPELLSKAKAFDKAPKITFFEGIGGLRTAYLKTLELKNDELLFWFDKDYGFIMSEDFMKEYTEKRQKQNSIVKSITPKSEKMIEYVNREKAFGRIVRFIDEKHAHFFGNSTIILFARRKVAIFSNKEEIATIIESEEIYKTLKGIFSFIWEILEDRG